MNAISDDKPPTKDRPQLHEHRSAWRVGGPQQAALPNATNSSANMLAIQQHGCNATHAHALGNLGIENSRFINASGRSTARSTARVALVERHCFEERPYKDIIHRVHRAARRLWTVLMLLAFKSLLPFAYRRDHGSQEQYGPETQRTSRGKTVSYKKSEVHV